MDATLIRFALFRGSRDVIQYWKQPGQWNRARYFAAIILGNASEAILINVSKDDCSEVFELHKGSYSRQRKWQIKKAAEGRCRHCGRPAARSGVCFKHLIQREVRRKLRAVKAQQLSGENSARKGQI